MCIQINLFLQTKSNLFERMGIQNIYFVVVLNYNGNEKTIESKNHSNMRKSMCEFVIGIILLLYIVQLLNRTK